MSYTEQQFFDGAEGNATLSIGGTDTKINVQKWLLRYLPIPSNIAQCGQLGSKLKIVDLEVSGTFEGKVNVEVAAGYLDKFQESSNKLSVDATVVLTVDATKSYTITNTCVQIDFLRDDACMIYQASFSGGILTAPFA